MTRRLVTAFLRLCLKIFFRRIEMLGLQRIPPDSAVVFAVNHPNGLVDPLFLLCFAPRAVSFLAKAPLFRYPVVGWFVRALDSIPVYRKQDETTGSNAETFSRARAVLADGGALAIFPEGTTHDDPRLRELKTGAARIALGASVAELVVVPTGIYYTSKQSFRSSALVVFGEPLRVKTVALDGSGEPPREAVAQLTSGIERALETVTLQAESHAALDLIARAEDIFTARDEQPLAQELDLRRRFVDGYRYLCARDPERLARLSSRIARFEAQLRSAKIEVHDLVPRVDVVRVLRLIVLLPLAFVGILTHCIPYAMVGVVARRLSKGEANLTATVKFISSLAFYPLTYVVFAVLAERAFGIVASLVVLILLPLFGYAAVRFLEDIDDVVGDLRALAHSMFRRHGHARLLVARRSIQDEMLAVAREMED